MLRRAAEKWLSNKIQAGHFPEDTQLDEQIYADSNYKSYTLISPSMTVTCGGLMCILVDADLNVHEVSTSPCDPLFRAAMGMVPDEISDEEWEEVKNLFA